jgi:hypothetical protein
MLDGEEAEAEEDVAGVVGVTSDWLDEDKAGCASEP